MGEYLNPSNRDFQIALQSQIYVDKTGLLQVTNEYIDTVNRYLCVSRPRRFGKSMTLSMLAAYYSRGCESQEMFSPLKIASSPDFEKYLNQYNVVRLNIVQELGKRSIGQMIDRISNRLLFECKKAYPDILFYDADDLFSVIEDIYSETSIPFIFLIDEWDCVFRERKINSDEIKEYLHFLRDLLKDRSYIALAYMTGILPIKKYGEHSALNMFTEYSMTNQRELAEYTGFTEKEVTALCEQYGMDISETRRWYNGYDVNGISIYNPRSVVQAMTGKIYDNYWTQTESYEALKIYIQMENYGVREVVEQLLGGGSYEIDTTTFLNDMENLESKDDVLTLLVHLGYLTYHFDDSTVSIPNFEIMQVFIGTIKKLGWTEVINALNVSNELMQATIHGDEARVAKLVEQAHQDATSLIAYNDENSLSCVLTLAYYAAKGKYTVMREAPAGKGYADLVFVPIRLPDAPAMVIELKWNKSAETALDQIKAKQYTDCLKDYSGKILLVGINYDPKDKKHTCKIERIEK